MIPDARPEGMPATYSPEKITASGEKYGKCQKIKERYQELKKHASMTRENNREIDRLLTKALGEECAWAEEIAYWYEEDFDSAMSGGDAEPKRDDK